MSGRGSFRRRAGLRYCGVHARGCLIGSLACGARVAHLFLARRAPRRQLARASPSPFRFTTDDRVCVRGRSVFTARRRACRTFTGCPPGDTPTRVVASKTSRMRPTVLGALAASSCAQRLFLCFRVTTRERVRFSPSGVTLKSETFARSLPRLRRRRLAFLFSGARIVALSPAGIR